MSLLTRRSILVLVTAACIPLMAATVLTQPAALKWVKAAPFPEPDEELYGISSNGKMYVFGGFGYQGKPRGVVYEYDAAADKWTQKKPMALPVQCGMRVVDEAPRMLLSTNATVSDGASNSARLRPQIPDRFKLSPG